MEQRDLDLLVSCWHPDVETVHPLRPDRSWRGTETYRRVMARIWESDPHNREEPTVSLVAGNIVYLETMTHHADGSVVPCVSVFEIEDGVIRRARVYTDQPTRDGVSMDSWVDDMNEEGAPSA
jgi:ketosteroid isomerase-like protein